MLVGPDDGGINHCVFVVCLSAQDSKDFLPDTRTTPTHVPQMHDAKVAKPLGQITP